MTTTEKKGPKHPTAPSSPSASPASHSPYSLLRPSISFCGSAYSIGGESTSTLSKAGLSYLSTFLPSFSYFLSERKTARGHPCTVEDVSAAIRLDNDPSSSRTLYRSPPSYGDGKLPWFYDSDSAGVDGSPESYEMEPSFRYAPAINCSSPTAPATPPPSPSLAAAANLASPPHLSPSFFRGVLVRCQNDEDEWIEWIEARLSSLAPGGGGGGSETERLNEGDEDLDRIGMAKAGMNEHGPSSRRRVNVVSGGKRQERRRCQRKRRQQKKVADLLSSYRRWYKKTLLRRVEGEESKDGECGTLNYHSRNTTSKDGRRRIAANDDSSRSFDREHGERPLLYSPLPPSPPNDSNDCLEGQKKLLQKLLRSNSGLVISDRQENVCGNDCNSSSIASSPHGSSSGNRNDAKWANGDEGDGIHFFRDNGINCSRIDIERKNRSEDGKKGRGPSSLLSSPPSTTYTQIQTSFANTITLLRHKENDLQTPAPINQPLKEDLSSALPSKTWTPISASRFHTRIGPGYARQGLKAPSPPALFQTVAVRLFRSKRRTRGDIVKVLPLPSIGVLNGAADHNEGASVPVAPLGGVERCGYGVPEVLVVHFQFPYEHPSVFRHKTDGFGGELLLYLRPTCHLYSELCKPSTGDMNPSVQLLLRWFQTCESDAEMRSRFKCLGLVRDLQQKNLGWVGPYNGKPTLITESGSVCKGVARVTDIGGGEDFGASYLIMSSNVHQWSFVGKKGLVTLLPRFKDFRIDLGFTIEAREEDEMPECILGCLCLNNLDDAAPMLPGSMVGDVDIAASSSSESLSASSSRTNHGKEKAKTLDSATC
mmetsp:Transcript_6973/g.15078  ORF Transcript_6973/g.15078 Transcript_6973/m.15078 type:complete len:823 (-) Transcript_6973:316-2784(-)